jgi:hypothetical protein
MDQFAAGRFHGLLAAFDGELGSGFCRLSRGEGRKVAGSDSRGAGGEKPTTSEIRIHEKRGELAGYSEMLAKVSRKTKVRLIGVPWFWM